MSTESDILGKKLGSMQPTPLTDEHGRFGTQERVGWPPALLMAVAAANHQPGGRLLSTDRLKRAAVRRRVRRDHRPLFTVTDLPSHIRQRLYLVHFGDPSKAVSSSQYRLVKRRHHLEG
jgi:hypothetical protein